MGEQDFYLLENPLTDSIRSTWGFLTKLEFSARAAIPSAIAGCVLLLVLGIQIVLWPYGWAPVVAHFLWQFVLTAKTSIRLSGSLASAMPHTVALGIYITILAPFAFLCLPMILIGLLGALIAIFTLGKDPTKEADRILGKGFHIIENPLTDAIRKTWALLTNLEFSMNTAVPSAVTGCVLLLVLVVLVILWPYGWVPVVSDFLWQFVLVAKASIWSDGYSAMPHTVALGIYIMIWAPFAFLCLPMLLIGLLGKKIALSTGGEDAAMAETVAPVHTTGHHPKDERNERPIQSTQPMPHRVENNRSSHDVVTATTCPCGSGKSFTECHGFEIGISPRNDNDRS